MYKEHHLKTDKEYFQSSKTGFKYFEVRLDDRDFDLGDMIILHETEYTGEQMKRGKPLLYTQSQPLEFIITYILRGPKFGIQKGFCVLSVKPRNGWRGWR